MFGRKKESIEGEAKPKEKINIQNARRVLHVFTNTHENDYSKPLPENSINQIRSAMRVVCEDLIQSHGVKEILQKNVPKGLVTIIFNQKLVKLSLISGGKFSLENWFSLEEPTNEPERVLNGFSDFRLNRFSRPYNPEKDFKLDEYRFMIRGLRWTAANILDWGNPNLIMPEELDNLPLPIPRTNPLES